MTSKPNLKLSEVNTVKILLPVLNWGLGHATRSLALAEELRKQGNSITLASDGEAFDFLKYNSGNFKLIPAPPTPKLSESTGNLAIDLVLRSYYMWLDSWNQEEQWISKLEDNFDLIISDGRLGCYSKHKPSILVNHQLCLMPPKFLKWTQRYVNKRIAKKFNKFHAIWIPGAQSEKRIFQNKLNYNPFVSIPTFPIPILSRLPTPNAHTEVESIAIVTGKSFLKEQLWKNIQSVIKANYPELIWGESIQLIWGGDASLAPDHAICNPIAQLLSNYIASAKQIHCAAGFSTLMDIAKLNPSVNIIPYPAFGQTEQEYFSELIKSNHFQL